MAHRLTDHGPGGPMDVAGLPDEEGPSQGSSGSKQLASVASHARCGHLSVESEERSQEPPKAAPLLLESQGGFKTCGTDSCGHWQATTAQREAWVAFRRQWTSQRAGLLRTVESQLQSQDRLLDKFLETWCEVSPCSRSNCPTPKGPMKTRSSFAPHRVTIASTDLPDQDQKYVVGAPSPSHNPPSLSVHSSPSAANNPMLCYSSSGTGVSHRKDAGSIASRSASRLSFALQSKDGGSEKDGKPAMIRHSRSGGDATWGAAVGLEPRRSRLSDSTGSGTRRISAMLSNRSFGTQGRRSVNNVILVMETLLQSWPVLLSCFREVIAFYIRAMNVQEPVRDNCLAKFIRRTSFEVTTGLVIFANAVFNVYMADWNIRHLDEASTPFSMSVDFGFCILFGIELLLKLCVHRMYFFWNQETRWNILDIMLLVVSVWDQAFVWAVWQQETYGNDNGATNWGFLRSLRILRLSRIFRVLRVIRVFRELRNMLMSIVGSFVSLFWCLLMLAFILVVFALIFVMQVTEYLSSTVDVEEEVKSALLAKFGSVFISMQTLYMATTGGDDWQVFYRLVSYTGVVNELLFIFYVSFFNFAVFNVLTGIFVDNAMKVSRADRDWMVMEQRRKEWHDSQLLKKVCEEMDEDCSGTITWEEFENHLQDPGAAAQMAALGLDVHDAGTFFDILELVSGKPEVDIDVFVRGCMRMKGAATSIDMHTLAYEIRCIRKEQEHFQVLFADLSAQVGQPLPPGALVSTTPRRSVANLVGGTRQTRCRLDSATLASPIGAAALLYPSEGREERSVERTGSGTPRHNRRESEEDEVLGRWHL